jgi:hypothetical protein
MDALVHINKQGLTLPSVEKVHIFRDPPKSIHTRKYEPVSTSDVMNKSREGSDRFEENISWFARGVDPMKSISYSSSGIGGQTSVISTSQPSSTYKVMKDGAFRPPMYRQEDVLPLSRQKRPTFSTHARVGPASASGFQFKNLSEMTIDKHMVRSAIHPSAAFNTGISGNPYENNMVLDRNRLAFSAVSGMKNYESEMESSDRSPNSGVIQDRSLQSIVSSMQNNNSGVNERGNTVPNSGVIQDRSLQSVVSRMKNNNSGVNVRGNTVPNSGVIQDRSLQSVVSRMKNNNSGVNARGNTVPNNGVIQDRSLQSVVSRMKNYESAMENSNRSPNSGVVQDRSLQSIVSGMKNNNSGVNERGNTVPNDGVIQDRSLQSLVSGMQNYESSGLNDKNSDRSPNSGVVQDRSLQSLVSGMQNYDSSGLNDKNSDRSPNSGVVQDRSLQSLASGMKNYDSSGLNDKNSDRSPDSGVLQDRSLQSLSSGMQNYDSSGLNDKNSGRSPNSGVVQDTLLQSVISTIKGEYGRGDLISKDLSNKPSGVIVIRPSYKVASGLGAPSDTVSISNLDDKTMKRAVKNRPLQSYLSPVFNLAVHDGTSRNMNMLKLPHKDLVRIASRVNAGAPIEVNGPHGQPIKLKDYTWTVYQSRVGTDTLLVEPIDNRRNIHLDPNTPHYSISSNIESQMKSIPEPLVPILDRNRPVISAFGLPTRPNVGDNVQRDRRLPDKMQLGGFSNQGTVGNAYRADMMPTVLSNSKTGLRENMRLNNRKL